MDEIEHKNDLQLNFIQLKSTIRPNGIVNLANQEVSQTNLSENEKIFVDKEKTNGKYST